MISIRPEDTLEETLEKLHIDFDDLMKNLEYIKGGRFPEKRNLAEEMPLNEAIAAFLHFIQGLAIETQIKYKGVLNAFEKFIYMQKQDATIGVIKKNDIEKFLNQNCEQSPYTYNNNRAVLSAFFKGYLTLDKGYLQQSPTNRIKRMREGHLEVQFLTKTEQQRVLATVLKNKESGKRDFLIVYLALNTGIRRSELVSLNVENIDLREDRFFVTGKGQKTREVFLHMEAKKALAQYLKHMRIGPFCRRENGPLFLNLKGPNAWQRITKEAIDKMIDRAYSKCGINKGGIHRLRHTFAINALESGMNIVEIMRLLGHENITTTIKYLRLESKQILLKVKTNFPLAFLSITNIAQVAEGSEFEKVLSLAKEVGLNDDSSRTN